MPEEKVLSHKIYRVFDMWLNSSKRKFQITCNTILTDLQFEEAWNLINNSIRLKLF